MIMENEFVKQLISCDIVVWNGVTTQWGIIRGFYVNGDMIRLADEDEVILYKKMQSHGN